MKNYVYVILALIGVFYAERTSAQEVADNGNAKRVLMVLSSHEDLGDTGKKTGFYLSEATHAYEVFKEAGFQITMVSPKGGEAPVDGMNLEDAINHKYWNNAEFRSLIKNTLNPEQVSASDYDAIYYAGGHGTMWDFTNNEVLAGIASAIYENSGVVAAVCHGPSALVNIRLSDGSYLVSGKRVSTFTNEEERTMQLEEVVPYLLETRLEERGAIIEKAPLWQEQVSVDSRLVTGQNPASASGVAREVVNLLK